METSRYVNSGTSYDHVPGSRNLENRTPMMQGDDVRFVQLRVGATPDGIFGPETERKVRTFQMLNFLRPTGRVEMMTWLKLAEIDDENGGSGSNGNTTLPVQGGQVTQRSRGKWILIGIAAVGIGIGAAYYNN